mmetsp:Transcript_176/g.534  ORF Transcript_176/g.534 Transcript_176/m.534 type:complete len:229 (+) Transcript_176:1349-2035(+)
MRTSVMRERRARPHARVAAATSARAIAWWTRASKSDRPCRTNRCSGGRPSSVPEGSTVDREERHAVLGSASTRVRPNRTAFHTLRRVASPSSASFTENLVSCLSGQACNASAHRRPSLPTAGIPLGSDRASPACDRAISSGARADSVRRACRSASERPCITSSGTMTLPSDLDILRPSSSRSIGCRTTRRKGARPTRPSTPPNADAIIDMRATQKYKMSPPVTSRSKG